MGIAILASPIGLRASPEPEPSASDSGAELLLFEEFPTVISAARRPQLSSQSSVPVSVIYAEDIHLSGATTIAEILRQVPGVDVLEIDRNRYAIGVRGLHSTFSERTLTLLDGRVADSPVFGGSEFLRLPISIEDIERIEVVRGPGGAAWGANAFTGVINVITKDPGNTESLVSATTDEHGDRSSHLRWADASGDWSWRVSAGWDDRVSSSEALDDGGPATRDMSETRRADLEAVYRPADGSTVSFGIGHSDRDGGSFEILGLLPAEDVRQRTTRAFARLEREFDGGGSGYLEAYANLGSDSDFFTLDFETDELDLGGQIDLHPWRGHELSLGGNVRSIRLRSSSLRGGFELVELPDTEYWAGFFLLDRWQAGPRVAIETQVRIDDYSETGTDWSARLGLLRALDEDRAHVLRLSTARAFRAPLTYLRGLQASLFEIVPGVHLLEIFPALSLRNESSWIVEGGYAWTSPSGGFFRIDAYYQELEDLIEFSSTPTQPLPGVFGAEIRPANLSSAEGRGIELEAAFETRFGRFSGWYARNELDLAAREPQGSRALLPARDKVGLRWTRALAAGWTLRAAYRYESETTSVTALFGPSASFPDAHLLDGSIAVRIGSERLELLLGVRDALDEDRRIILDPGSLAGHATPGRTFFFRLQLRP